MNDCKTIWASVFSLQEVTVEGEVSRSPWRMVSTTTTMGCKYRYHGYLDHKFFY